MTSCQTRTAATSCPRSFICHAPADNWGKGWRSSFNKDEAKALNQQLVQGVASMAQTGQAVYEAISERMDLRPEKLALQTILAATDAASGSGSARAS